MRFLRKIYNRFFQRKTVLGRAKKEFEKRFFRFTALSVVLFLFVWLLVGESLGVVTLLGLIRPGVDWLRLRSVSQFTEDLFARSLMAIFFSGSLLLSIYLTRLILYAQRFFAFTLITGILLSSAATSWLFFLGKYESNIEIESTNGQFTFGSYPSYEKMVELKNKGYTTVVSLLSPVEGFHDEEADAKRAGLEYVRLPMVPWIDLTQNKAAVDQAIELASDEEKRYYIHCYLGKDRARVIRLALTESKRLTFKNLPMQSRNIRQIRSFERGPILHLPGGHFLSAEPSPGEMLLFVFYTDIKGLVLLRSEETNPFIQIEDSMIDELESASLLPIPLTRVILENDPEKLSKQIQIIKSFPSPQLIIYPGSLNEGSYTSDSFRTFLSSYRYDLPSIHPVDIEHPFAEGPIALITPNCIVGPRPTEEEFARLAQIGIKKVLYIAKFGGFTLDAERAAKYGMGYEKRSEKNPFSWREGGPFYIYGPRVKTPYILRADVGGASVEEYDTQKYLISQPSKQEVELLGSSPFLRKVYMLTREVTPALIAEQKSLKKMGVKSEIVAISKLPFEQKKLWRYALKIRNEKGPIAIQYDPSEPYLIEGFKQAYGSEEKPLPPSLFADISKARVLGPNLAIGPYPGPDGFMKLSERGVRGVECIAYKGLVYREQESKLAREAGLSWEQMIPPRAIYYAEVKEGGPWYLYGPQLSNYAGRLRDLLGPAIPPCVLDYTVSGLSIDLKGIFSRFPLKSALLLVPTFFFYLLLVVRFVSYLAAKKKLDIPYTRKIFHFFIFFAAGILKLFFSLQILILFGMITSLLVAYTLLSGKKFLLYKALARPKDAPNEKRYILIPFLATGLGGILSYTFFGNFSAVGFFVCGCGDAVGEVIGRRFGAHPYRVPSLSAVKAIRTLEGSIGVLIFSFFVAVPSLLFLQVALLPAFAIGAAVALFSAVVEAISSHGTDNLTVQLAASGMAYYLCTTFTY